MAQFEHYIEQQKDLSEGTINKHLRNIRTLINEGIQQGFMKQEQYPFKNLKLKKPKPKYKNLSEDEVSALEKLKVDKPLDHVLDAFLFCCYTGLRYSDFANIRNAEVEVIGGKKWLQFKSIKTGVETSVPLETLFSGKAWMIFCKYGQEKLGEVGSNSFVNAKLKEIMDRIGASKKYTFHSARHTCATMLIRRGVPITTVQKILGHTDVSTTQRYAEIGRDTIERDIANIE